MKEKELIQTVAIIYRYQIMILNQRLSKYQMTTGLAPFLLSIDTNPGTSLISLSRELFIDKATTTKAVTKLIDGGFIEKMADPADRRAFKLYITPKGKDICREVRVEASIFREEILEGCSQEDYKATLKVLGQVFENMRKISSH
ncbi:MarR family transcriptional regulator [Propionigenium maris DSM 9537]|uniref:MarR family transcriptional regulator n=1 Tax=Propionigenium maris DSM 9537 TaxID=1123000 RepID=A0A9W6LMH9_9FUSO|nr:MarR family transcriptional regulator [Propionigenium maris]GLI54935.1 MarR family transcriptional regulator [Propionigenium maris DSM 9537]